MTDISSLLAIAVTTMHGEWWTCLQPVGAANVKVYGPAVEAPVTAHSISYLIVDCKEAGPGCIFELLTVIVSVSCHVHLGL